MSVLNTGLGQNMPNGEGTTLLSLNKKQQFLLVLVVIFSAFHSSLAEGFKFIVLIQKMNL